MTNRISNQLNDATTNGTGAATAAPHSEDSPVSAAVANNFKQLVQRAEDVVTSHPLAAISVAAAAGIALGWWVKRK